MNAMNATSKDNTLRLPAHPVISQRIVDSDGRFGAGLVKSVFHDDGKWYVRVKWDSAMTDKDHTVHSFVVLGN